MPIVALKDLPRVLTKHDVKCHKALERGIMAGARAGRTHLVRVTPKDRGMAKAAWKTFKGPGGSQPVAYNENSAPYIGVLEMGARPHKVSEAGQFAIFEWVQRHFHGVETGSTRTWKNLLAESSEGKIIGKGKRSVTHKLVIANSGDIRGTQLAWKITKAICWKIQRYGVKPHYFVRDSMELMTRMVQGEVDRNLKAISDKEDGK